MIDDLAQTRELDVVAVDRVAAEEERHRHRLRQQAGVVQAGHGRQLVEIYADLGPSDRRGGGVLPRRGGGELGPGTEDEQDEQRAPRAHRPTLSIMRRASTSLTP